MSEEARLFALVLGLFLFTVIPTFAVTARRLHDVNRSAWSRYTAIWVFTYVGYLLTKGDDNSNYYGPPPDPGPATKRRKIATALEPNVGVAHQDQKEQLNDYYKKVVLKSLD